MKEFLIRQSERGIEIIDPATGATTDKLSTGEIIEQIIALFAIQPRTPYPMKTPQEWGEYFVQIDEA